MMPVWQAPEPRQARGQPPPQPKRQVPATSEAPVTSEAGCKLPGLLKSRSSWLAWARGYTYSSKRKCYRLNFSNAEAGPALIARPGLLVAAHSVRALTLSWFRAESMLLRSYIT